MPEVQITEIYAGATVFSKKHQQNVRVIKVNEDATVEIEITKTDTVPSTDLTTKH